VCVCVDWRVGLGLLVLLPLSSIQDGFSVVISVHALDSCKKIAVSWEVAR
jgi:hypothetical protein